MYHGTVFEDVQEATDDTRSECFAEDVERTTSERARGRKTVRESDEEQYVSMLNSQRTVTVLESASSAAVSSLRLD